jgi:hypothetical protein
MTEISAYMTGIPYSCIHSEKNGSALYPKERSETRCIFFPELDQSSLRACKSNMDIIFAKRNNTSIENDVNNSRVSILEQNFTRRFIPNIPEENFEYRITSKACVLVKEQMRRSTIATKDWKYNNTSIDNEVNDSRIAVFKQNFPCRLISSIHEENSKNSSLKEYERSINLIKDNSASIENEVNDNRIAILERDFTRRLISSILEENFEYGIASKTHVLVKEQMKINAIATKDWLGRIFANNFKNARILIGILQIISRFGGEEIHPAGEVMARAALVHKDEVVQETAIRAFESWGGARSLKTLENVSVSSSWVKEYLDEVISDLKLEYAC